MAMTLRRNDVRQLVAELSTIPDSTMMANVKDQLLVFSWFVRLQRILGEDTLPPDLLEEVLQALVTGLYVAPDFLPDTGSLIEAAMQNGNYYIFHSLRNNRGIHPDQLQHYVRWLKDSSRVHVLDYHEYALLKALLS